MGDYTLVAIEVTNKITGVVSSDFIKHGRLTAHLKKMKKDDDNGVLDVAVAIDLLSSEPLLNDEVQALTKYPFVTLKE